MIRITADQDTSADIKVYLPDIDGFSLQDLVAVGDMLRMSSGSSPRSPTGNSETIEMLGFPQDVARYLPDILGH